MNSEFRAHVAGLNTTDKKIKLTLELDAEINPNALFSVHQMVGEKVIVNMGSPQMSMNFDEPENEEMHLEQPAGIKYETDSSGVVVNMFPLPEPTQEEKQELAAEGETVIEGEFTVVTEDQEKKEQERDNTEQGPTEKEIEEYILSGKAPIFEDIKFDFPELLHKKQKLGSWKKVAMQTGDSIGQLTREYKAYKARVAEQMRDGDTA
ncbi:hypothetical protein [Aneurinibacillus aneurinilyticus]|uniref:Uncharacterized protein n=1 Tax=Aneurinibacillus aneurinilyticus ATCC 12856 TaxID=649747 RepID=U1YJB0_ANEAE|nr:hypothetical protein [Aneurinibacillus aneurinilyticus]ERI10856.1 hypothetical protein HMPREF0083_01044 [Aneurinibacillus aneurinilyticus ATCC 12856]MED0673156.1 hypothetical protein [Aneurinibacillus aneurinilyticus]MED0704910.1 hypothetical protein [Aneurinibacillus aneurinilyticus]MED0724048.1 hypothetical protein [Aneurinibacillus aneurinilyticus]MED0731955.1 hypothetical protein [Aneurinibacillus aneurinilyticus]